MNEILREKYPEYKLCDDIVKNDPDILTKADFGDIIAKKLKETLKAPSEKAPSKKDEKRTYTEEEVQQRIKEAQEMERQRLENIDAGDSSTRREVRGTPKNKMTPDEEFLTRHAMRAGMDQAKIDRIIKRHNDRARAGLVTARTSEPSEE